MSRLLVCKYSHTAWGGIDTWLDGFVERVSTSGWDVVIGLARGRRFNDPIHANQAHARYPTTPIDGRTGTRFGRVHAVYRAIRRVQPDVVLPLGLGDAYAGAALARLRGARVRLLVAMHAINCELLADLCAVEPVVDLCVAVNPLQEQFLRGPGRYDPRRLCTIVNGVNVPDAPVPRAAAPESPLRIAFVGRLNRHHKRVLDLVPIVQFLRKKRIAFVLTIVGSGEDETVLRERLAQDVAAGFVRFTGYVPMGTDQPTIYSQQDVLIVCSPPLGEACPLVIEEAMAHGVVPVSSAWIGIRSLPFVIEGETALLYECGDPPAAAECLGLLARDCTRLLRMSQACSARSATISSERMHRRWIETLDELANSAPRPAVGLDRIVDPRQDGGRLDRWLTPAAADLARRAIRRWPHFSDGWSEWPGTCAAVDERTRKTMVLELQKLDRLAGEVKTTHVAS